MAGKLFKGVIALGVLYFVVAFALVFWPGEGHSDRAVEVRRALDAGEVTPAQMAAKFSGLGGPSHEQVYPFEHVFFEMRDGVKIHARRFSTGAAITILAVHGLDGTSAQFNIPSGLMSSATGANVVALDLRGHGLSGGNRWDVDYVGQHEDDIAQVIAVLQAEQPGGRVILMGHSMGGGIALRYAALEDHPQIAGYLLFAPLLGQTAPTTRTEPPSMDDLPEGMDEAFAVVRIPRIIGLIMFNVARINAFDYLPVMFVNMSPDPSVYTWRALQSGSPADYAGALGSVDEPLLVIVGSNDQPFIAHEFEPVISAHSEGQTLVVDGEDHVSILESHIAIDAVASWVAGL